MAIRSLHSRLLRAANQTGWKPLWPDTIKVKVGSACQSLAPGAVVTRAFKIGGILLGLMIKKVTLPVTKKHRVTDKPM